MNRILFLLCISVAALCGCVNVTNLTDHLAKDNAAYSVEIRRPLGHRITITRVAPILGTSSKATVAGEVSVSPPDGTKVQVSYLVPHPQMQQTNQPPAIKQP